MTTDGPSPADATEAERQRRIAKRRAERERRYQLDLIKERNFWPALAEEVKRVSALPPEQAAAAMAQILRGPPGMWENIDFDMSLDEERRELFQRALDIRNGKLAHCPSRGQVVSLVDERPYSDDDLPDDFIMLDYLLARTSRDSRQYGYLMRMRGRLSAHGRLPDRLHTSLIAIYRTHTLWTLQSGGGWPIRP